MLLRRSDVALSAVLVWFSACGNNATAPSTVTPTTVPAPPPAPAPSPTLPTLPPTPSANRPPIADVRFTPPPAADGFIDIDTGDTVKVNGGRSFDPDGDPLFLTVKWGDGLGNHIKCGPCRLEHVYRKRGLHTLRATISDLKANVDTTVTVFAH